MSNTAFAQDEAIRARAYKIWEDEGRPEGKAEAHWLRAVTELTIPSLMAANKPKKKAKR